MFEVTAKPGEAWLEIVSRPTLKAFSQAFAADPILEATCAKVPLTGVDSIFKFFRATRSMYERIGFDGGVIGRIRLYHYPIEQLSLRGRTSAQMCIGSEPE